MSARAPAGRSPRRVLAFVLGIAMSLLALPSARASAPTGTFTGSASVDVVGTEEKARLSGHFELPLGEVTNGPPHIWELGFHGAEKRPYFGVASRSVGSLTDSWGARFDFVESTIHTDGYGDVPTFQEGECTVALTQNDANGVAGSIDCPHLSGDPLFGVAVSGEVTMHATFSVTAGGPPPSGSCVVKGTVTDRRSRAVEGIHVHLEYGTNVQDVATGADGRYAFAEIGAGSGFDLAKDRVTVRVLGEEYQDDPHHFQILFGDEVAAMASDAFEVKPGASCTRDFDGSGLPGNYEGPPAPATARDLLEVYQDLDAAWALTNRLGVRPAAGLPLRVYAWCEVRHVIECPDATAGGRYYPGQHYLGLVSRVSKVEPFTPFTIAHEFGHAMRDDLLGGSPPIAGTNHGGYFRNGTSTDGLSEAFAHFYAVMTAKYVTGGSDVTNTPDGSIELDCQPWLLDGKAEEYAIAGALLDLEDGPDDYAGKRGRVSIPEADVHVDTSIGFFAVDVDPGFAGMSYTAELLDGSGQTIGIRRGTVTALDGKARVAGTLTNKGVASVRLGLFPGGAADDDPIDGDLAATWQMLVDARPTTVVDLYQAMKARFAGDRDGNGTDDVDQIFTAHGLYADVAGNASNQKYDGELAGEQPGLTSHYGKGSYGDMVPRSSTPPIPELTARIDTGGVAAQALVNVSLEAPNDARSYSMLAATADDGSVRIPAPPPGYTGTVSVVMLADGYLPQPAMDLDVGKFWTDANANPGASFLTASVQMVAGSLDAGESSRTRRLLWALVIVMLLFSGSLIWLGLGRPGLRT